MAQLLTREVLGAVAPSAASDMWAPQIIAGCARYGVDNSALSLAMFLATTAEETGGFHQGGMRENGNYSAERAVQVWPSLLTHEKALELTYVRDGGVRLFNYVYDDRVRGPGLGNVYDGDGWLFRGGGIIQLTGRSLYTRYDAAANQNGDIVAKPQRVADEPEHAVGSACWYWKIAGCIQVANTGDFTRLTLLVNGGLTNMPARMAFYLKARAALGLPGDGTHGIINDNGNKLLTVGTRGAAVLVLEQRLQELGFDVGPEGPNSDFDNYTRQAVWAYQQASRLEVDGIAGNQTRRALGLIA